MKRCSGKVVEYQKDREHIYWIAVDLRPSMFFGYHTLKIQKAIELAGLIGRLSCVKGYRLGLYCFGVRGSRAVLPQTGDKHMHYVLKMIHDCYDAEQFRACEDRADSLSRALRELAEIASQRSTIFLLSDFLGDGMNWKEHLGQLSGRHEICAFLVFDRSEREFPVPPMRVRISDPESGKATQIDTIDGEVVQAYTRAAEEHLQGLQKTLGTLGEMVSVSTEDNVFGLLEQFSPVGEAMDSTWMVNG